MEFDNWPDSAEAILSNLHSLAAFFNLEPIPKHTEARRSTKTGKKSSIFDVEDERKSEKHYSKELVTAVDSMNKAKFLNLFYEHKAKKSDFKFQDIITNLDADEIDKMWNNLLKLLVSYCNIMFERKAKKIKNVQVYQETSQILQATIELARVILDNSLPVSVGLLHIMVFLNGIILNIPNKFGHLRFKIINLCERMFHLNYVSEHQYFTSNAVIYLLKHSLSNKCHKREVKRVFAFRSVIPKILLMKGVDKDLMWELFKKCAQSDLYTTMPEGLKILTLFLTMDINRITEIHYMIKKKLPSCSKSQSNFYGRVYYNAWLFSVKAKDKELKLELQSCIQDFILSAIEGKSKLLLNSICHVLSQFHMQKKETFVAKMLYEMYQPILWRYLKSSKGLVRSNACRLFLEVFPLEDPDVTVVVSDMQLNEQLLLIKDFLLDDYPIVRTNAINGLCFSMSAHWELFPDEIKKTYFKILVDDLSRDSSSAEVRAAVAKGLKTLLENPLTVPTLHSILPQIVHLFHDHTDSVRIAFCQLLLKVKKICSIKYYEIISMDNILARIEIDEATARLLSNLLHNSFFPKDSTPEVWLLRCANAISKFPAACRVLFSYLPSYISVQTVLQYITQAAKCIHCFVDAVASHKPPNKISKKNFKKASNENKSELDSSDMYTLGVKCGFQDAHVVSGFMDSFAILWVGSVKNFQKPEYKTEFKKMIAKLSKYLSDLILYYKNSPVFDSIAYLGSFIPAVNMPCLASLCFKQLKCMTIESDPSDYKALLLYLCNQKQGDSILYLLKEWIEIPFQQNPQTSRSNRRKISHEKRFQEIFPPKPLLGVKMLSSILEDYSCQKSILEENSLELSRFLHLTDKLKAKIESLQRISILDEGISFYSELLYDLVVISILLYDKNVEYPNMKFMIDIIMWVEGTLLKLVWQVNNYDAKSKKSSRQSTTPFNKLVFTICKAMCILAGDLKLCGLPKLEDCTLMNFGMKLLDLECGSDVILPVSKLLSCHAESERVNSNSYKENVCETLNCFKKILECLREAKFFDAIPISHILEISANLSQSLFSMVHHGVVRDLLLDVMQAFVRTILDEISKDLSRENIEKNCKPFSEVQISKYSAFLLTTLCEKQKVLACFLQQLSKYITNYPSSILSWVSSCVIILHVGDIRNVSKTVKKEMNGIINNLEKILKELCPVKPASHSLLTSINNIKCKEDYESTEKYNIKINFERHCHLEMRRILWKIERSS